MSSVFSRRRLVLGALGMAGAGLLGGCSPPVLPGGSTSVPTEPVRPSLPAPAVRASIRAGVGEVDLGGVTATTWMYDGVLPGPELRVKAGQVLAVEVENALPAETSVHWHGIRLHNAADGVPGLTQAAIPASGRYTYTFLAPDPGTYFFHPHSGVQLDRGLYAPLIVEDPAEPGDYDVEWLVVLDDWTDGVGASPDDLLAGLRKQGGSLGGGGHDMSGMGGMGASPLGDVGDIRYPHYLVNGRVPAAARTLTARPGQRARIRMINAAADTLFRVVLGGHVLTVTHTDGFPVEPTRTRALYLSQGERADVVVTLEDGVFPLVAAAEGKGGQGLLVVRTGAGGRPAPDVSPAELGSDPLLLSALTATQAVRLADREPDQVEKVTLDGQMKPYAWGINATTFGSDTPIRVRTGTRVRMQVSNRTMMAHPMHIHGHTWSLPGSGGLRKDTLLVLPMQTVAADLQADNPGRWAYHCHNIYHAEVGMMTSVEYG